MLPLLYDILLCLFAALPWVPLAFFWASCPCCATCPVASDNFSADNLATNYTTVAGSWSVGSGVLTTSSANALLIHNSPTIHEGKGFVSVTATCSTNGAQARIIGGWTDSDNYWIGEVTWNAGDIDVKLYRRVGGVTTQVGQTVNDTFYNTGDAIPMEMCWNASGVTFRVPPSGADIVIGDSLVATGTKAGLGTATTGGTVTFDDLTITNEQTVHTSCENCDVCACGVRGQFFQLDIAGIVSAACTTCENYNGTFIHRRPESDCNMSNVGYANATCGNLNGSYTFSVGTTTAVLGLSEGVGGPSWSVSFSENYGMCILDGSYSDSVTRIASTGTGNCDTTAATLTATQL